jgi:hypothetical protein
MIAGLLRTKPSCPAAILSLLLFRPAVARPQEVTGDWVARQVEERDTGRDGRLEMEMRLYDRRGRETVRRLTLLSRRDGGLDKVLLRFNYPGDIQDTAFLAVESARGEDDRFLFLPSLGRSRRISAQEKQESFVGSDLTYEDISGRRLADYSYRLLGEGVVDGRACYLLESVAREPQARYPRSVSRVDRETFVVRSGEIYDRTGEKAKQYRAERIEKIDGIWTVGRMTMENLKHATRTVLATTRAEYNRGVPESAFTRQSLESPHR